MSRPSLLTAALVASALLGPQVPAGAAVPTAAGPARDAAPVMLSAGWIQRLPMTMRTTAPTVGEPGPEVASAVLATEDFNVAAVTWEGGEEAELSAWVRVRTGAGWTPWSEVHDDHHEPDPGMVPDGFRAGTEPFVTEDADAIEVRVVSQTSDPLPQDLTLELIDPGESATDADAGTEVEPLAPLDPGTADELPEPAEVDVSTASATTGDASQAVAAGAATVFSAADADVRVAIPARPYIHNRAAWGADETLRQNAGEPIAYGQVLGGFVHHTAGTNSYSKADVPALIRGIYRYHVLSRDFWDVGYNFLVDRFGRIWEGAYGGMDKAVIAAHTKYYNSYSFALSAMGDYTSKTPESAVIAAYQKLFAWKLAVHGVRDPNGVAQYYAPNSEPQKVISGHRDTKSTACPGQRLYEKLPQIRSGAAARIEQGVAKPVLTGPASVAVGTYTTLGITWRSGPVPVTGTVALQRLVGSTWSTVRQVAVVDGTATTAVAPSRTSQYRLKAVTAWNPTNIDMRPGLSSPYRVETTASSPDRASALDLAGPAVIMPRAYTRLDVGWTSAGTPVTGTAVLEVLRDGAWARVRDVAVSSGVATTAVAPAVETSYRVRMATAASPSGVSSELSTPAEVTIAVASDATQVRTEFSVTGPTQVAASTYTPLELSWHSGGWAVSGTVVLEVWRASAWARVREVAVVDGAARTAVAPGSTSQYRLRSLAVTHPRSLAAGQTSEPLTITVG